MAGSFLVPLILADQLELQRDVYYGLYVTAVVGLFVAWARDTDQPLREMFARRWPLALGLGIAVALVSAFIAVRAEEGSGHPGGLEFIAAIGWRGVVYGAADGLLISGFPILVVFAAGRETRLWGAVRGRAALGALALAASLAFTATYHLGYADFRSAKLRRPLTGDVVWSTPTLLTANPLGSVIAHCGLHLAAVWRSPDSDVFLPPHRR